MKREEALEIAKPILFNTDMVRAIQNGIKTSTRRIVRNNPCECTSKVVNGVCKLCDDKGGFYLPDDYVKARSPYQVGDMLYVRETWQELKYKRPTVAIPDDFKEKEYVYLANGDICNSDGSKFKWKPSIHMPKEAARFFLRITDVRVERLQDIADEQVEQEGIYLSLKKQEKRYTWGDGVYDLFPKSCFRRLWNGNIKESDLTKYGWAANPWVWVIEFERLEVIEQ